MSTRDGSKERWHSIYEDVLWRLKRGRTLLIGRNRRTALIEMDPNLFLLDFSQQLAYKRSSMPISG